ncbi:MAG TPA: GDSL-type esterase/lipase family protein [Burkholderiales bacterium]|nr:GDSL-type esterase/lipase family protein [Burkholderiales bacterium]
MGKHVARVLLSAIVCFVLVETALQWRSHVRYGQSVFNAIKKESLYVTDRRTGLKTLRPHSGFAGSQAVIQTNSLGLRSAEISPVRRKGDLRIAVVGASTVMGAYAASNDDTFAAILQRELRALYPERQIDVINAGIAGYTLLDQALMLKHRVAALQPDFVIVYPGFNDFGRYCSKQNRTATPAKLQGLPLVELPSWLLSLELITKNTVFLRTTPKAAESTVDPRNLNLNEYRDRLETLTHTAEELGLKLIMATNARAYRPDQPLKEQYALSETARYYNPCFDIAGLHALYDLHNEIIREHAAARDIPLIPLDEMVPGGKKNFADASHFSPEGEKLVAQQIRNYLVDAYFKD